MSEPKELTWRNLYSECDLYKAALRLYTKPLFNRRKACSASHDRENLFDFARHGLENVARLHHELARGTFAFRPGQAVHHDFNGKHRTLYVYPWRERLVDLLLYRLLNQRFSSMFLPCSYAYRIGTGGVDACQNSLTAYLRSQGAPVYGIKRDIRNYFDSIDHTILERKVFRHVVEDDYLASLLRQRIHFDFYDDGGLKNAARGVPFGTAIGCFLANLYLHDLDAALFEIPELRVYRYADDILALSPNRDTVVRAKGALETGIAALNLDAKESHTIDLRLANDEDDDRVFSSVRKFRHLGLEFQHDGMVRLSKDKGRKIRNLFKYAFRRAKSKFRRIQAPHKRARLAISIAKEVLGQGLRNIGIIDYYLKHVDDEQQIKEIDRWLAEEVLAVAFQNGHKKGNFKKLSFRTMRDMGLPSLVHRRRLILHGHIESSFFIWRTTQTLGRADAETANPACRDFSPDPEAAESSSARERGPLPVDGRDGKQVNEFTCR